MAQAVSPIELGKELVKTLRELNRQIEQVKDDAHSRAVDPYALRDSYGNHKMANLLVAKAQVLHGLALINTKREKQ